MRMVSRRTLLVSILVAHVSGATAAPPKPATPKAESLEAPLREVFGKLGDAVMRADEKLFREQFLPGAFEKDLLSDWAPPREFYMAATSGILHFQLEPLFHRAEQRAADLIVVPCLEWAPEIELSTNIFLAVLRKHEGRWLLVGASEDEQAVEKYVKLHNGAAMAATPPVLDVKPLLEALHASDEVSRWKAAGALSGTPRASLAEVIPALVAAVKKDRAAWVRFEALGSLSDLAPDSAVMIPLAMHALKDEDKLVRGGGVMGLIKFGGAEAQRLTGATKDVDARVRAGAIAALAALEADPAPPAKIFLDGVLDSDGLVRARAAFALAQLVEESPESRIALEKLVNDPDARVRWIASHAFETESDE